MDVWITFLVDVVIAGWNIQWGSLNCVLFMVIGMMLLFLGGIFKINFTYCNIIVAAHSFWSKWNMSLPSVWIIVYLNPNYMIESISSGYLCQIKYHFLDSLSHIMNVFENLKFAKCKGVQVALPSIDIDDPSAVLRCTAADSILVL